MKNIILIILFWGVSQIQAQTKKEQILRLTHQADSLNQSRDIFRVGDIIGYPNQPTDEVLFLEVGSLTYTDGTDFVAENTFSNISQR